MLGLLACCGVCYYQSIALTNKGFYHEAEAEWIRNMRLFLEEVMAGWSHTHSAPLRIAIPTTIPEIKRIEIAVSLSPIRVEGAYHEFPAAFLPLLDLHVSLLAFSFYGDEQTPKDKAIAQQADARRAKGLFQFMRRIEELFKKRLNLKLDDGTTHQRDEGVQIDAIALLWDTSVNGMIEVPNLCQLANDKIVFRTLENVHLPGVWYVAGLTWHHYYTLDYGGDGRMINLEYSRDLQFH
jgi:hypothetical protein